MPSTAIRRRPRRSFVSTDVEIVASPAIADITGGGTPEVLVAAAGQITALGPDLGVVEAGIGSTPAVNRKASVAVGRMGGTWALVAVGFDAAHDGYVQAFDIPTPSAVPWPMHRMNARRLGVGSELGPLPASGFYDVPDASVYSPSVRWAADRGITGGCTATRFCPSRPVDAGPGRHLPLAQRR